MQQSGADQRGAADRGCIGEERDGFGQREPGRDRIGDIGSRRGGDLRGGRPEIEKAEQQQRRDTGQEGGRVIAPGRGEQQRTADQRRADAGRPEIIRDGAGHQQRRRARENQRRQKIRPRRAFVGVMGVDNEREQREDHEGDGIGRFNDRIAADEEHEEAPAERRHRRRNGQPAPAPQPCEAEGGCGHDGEVERENGEIGLGRGDEQRRGMGADEPEPGEPGPVQRRGGHGGKADHRQQQEGEGRPDHAVKRIGAIGGREQADRTGRREDAGDIGSGNRRKGGDARRAAQPFAAGEQRDREGGGERDAHARSDQSGIDRIADEEDRAECQRQAADPDGPARAEALLEAFARLGRRGRGRGRLGSGRRLAGRLGCCPILARRGFHGFGLCQSGVRGDRCFRRNRGLSGSSRDRRSARCAEFHRDQPLLDLREPPARADQHEERHHRQNRQCEQEQNPEGDQSIHGDGIACPTRRRCDRRLSPRRPARVVRRTASPCGDRASRPRRVLPGRAVPCIPLRGRRRQRQRQGSRDEHGDA